MDSSEFGVFHATYAVLSEVTELQAKAIKARVHTSRFIDALFVKLQMTPAPYPTQCFRVSCLAGCYMVGAQGMTQSWFVHNTSATINEET